jgi:GntR family transcriptional regulator/MocR family aminotransferase
MRNIYRVRHEMITRSLNEEFADHLQTITSTVGLHVAALARTASVDELGAVVRRASAAGVQLQTLSRFAVQAPPKSGIMLGYGAIPAEHIEEGLRRLRLCFSA